MMNTSWLPEIEQRCHAALSRLLHIDWHQRRIYDDPSIAPSCVALAKEFIRRVLLWHPEPLAPVRAPSVDLAAVIAPEAPIPLNILTLAEQKLPLSPRFGLRVCLNYLKWSAIEHLRVIGDQHAPSPYEPAIRLFERGGELWSEHGFLHVHHNIAFVIGYGKYQPAPPLLDLTDQALDVLDRRHEQRRE